MVEYWTKQSRVSSTTQLPSNFASFELSLKSLDFSELTEFTRAFARVGRASLARYYWEFVIICCVVFLGNILV